MDFHTYQIQAQQMIRSALCVEKQGDRFWHDSAAVFAACLEQRWQAKRRPYYNVWPCIAEYLLRVRIDNVLAEHINLPVAPICIRFAKEKGPSMGGLDVYTLLVGFIDANEDSTDRHVIVVVSSSQGMHVSIPLLSLGQSIEDCIAGSNNEVFLRDCFRLAVGISGFREGDPWLKPDILSNDIVRCESDPSLLPAAVERARRRGKVGWNLGGPDSRGSTPCIVRPHLHTYLTGKGRVNREFRWIDSYARSAKKITDVPTGYHDDELAQCVGSA